MPEVNSTQLTTGSSAGHFEEGRIAMVACLQIDDKKTFLWAVNPTRDDVFVDINVRDTWAPFSKTKSHWGEAAKVTGARTVQSTIPARDCLVIELV